jgi:hypothetical protein
VLCSYCTATCKHIDGARFGSLRAHCIALDIRMVSQPYGFGAKTARDCQPVQARP